MTSISLDCNVLTMEVSSLMPEVIVLNPLLGFLAWSLLVGH